MERGGGGEIPTVGYKTDRRARRGEVGAKAGEGSEQRAAGEDRGECLSQ